jgi:hypothetical protein
MLPTCNTFDNKYIFGQGYKKALFLLLIEGSFSLIYFYFISNYFFVHLSVMKREIALPHKCQLRKKWLFSSAKFELKEKKPLTYIEIQNSEVNNV